MLFLCFRYPSSSWIVSLRASSKLLLSSHCFVITATSSSSDGLSRLDVMICGQSTFSKSVYMLRWRCTVALTGRPQQISLVTLGDEYLVNETPLSVFSRPGKYLSASSSRLLSSPAPPQPLRRPQIIARTSLARHMIQPCTASIVQRLVRLRKRQGRRRPQLPPGSRGSE